MIIVNLIKQIFSIVIVIQLISLTLLSVAVIHLPPKMTQSPDDIYYVFGQQTNTLIWQFEAEESEDHPTVYNVTIDNVLVLGHENQMWFDNVDIVVNVDNLEIGRHEVVITVFDDGVPEFAPATVDQASVTVVATSVELPTSETSDAALHNSIFIVFIFGLALYLALPILRMRNKQLRDK